MEHEGFSDGRVAAGYFWKRKIRVTVQEEIFEIAWLLSTRPSLHITWSILLLLSPYLIFSPSPFYLFTIILIYHSLSYGEHPPTSSLSQHLPSLSLLFYVVSHVIAEGQSRAWITAEPLEESRSFEAWKESSLMFPKTLFDMKLWPVVHHLHWYIVSSPFQILMENIVLY